MSPRRRPSWRRPAGTPGPAPGAPSPCRAPAAGPTATRRPWATTGSPHPGAGSGRAGGEAGRLLARRERDTPLVSQIDCGARDTAGESDAHGLARAVDRRPPELGTLFVGRREEPQVLDRELRCQPGDEHGGAHDLS